MLRALALLTAAFALFLSPIMMAGGSAMAHAPEPMAAMMDGHCEGMMPPSHGSHDGKADLKIDCAAACSALFATPPAVQPRIASIGALPSPVRLSSLDGILIGHEPPPPRFPTKS